MLDSRRDINRSLALAGREFQRNREVRVSLFTDLEKIFWRLLHDVLNNEKFA
jgi:hypothetical protein